MIDTANIVAIDIHTHAEEPCGGHRDDGYHEFQAGMAAYFRNPAGADGTEALRTAVAFGAAAVTLPGSVMPGPSDVRTDQVHINESPDLDTPLKGDN